MLYALCFLLFTFGLFINALAAARLAMASNGTSVKTVLRFLEVRWLPLLLRWVVCTFTFLLAWGNPAFGIMSLIQGGVTVHLGAAGLLGFAADEFTSKILGFLGLQKALPGINP